MMRGRRPGLLLLGACLVGCGGGVIQRADALPPPPPGSGFVQIFAEPADARVYVDGEARGRLDGYPEGVLRLPVGRHRLSLRRPGHYPWYGQIEVGEQPTEIRTRLVPIPR